MVLVGAAAVAQWWRNEDRRQPKAQQFVANPAYRSHKWCSCGALIRGGKCVSATCGKSA